MDYSNVTKGYKDRIERVALFDCLFRLEKKQKKDNDGSSIDFFGLGLLTLMFFFENMLIRNKKTGIMELANYLQGVSLNKIKLDQAGFVEISKNIIDVFRPSSGKRNRREFYNYETGVMDYVDYSILKADSWDSVRNIQYYVLDEQGLELIFATKEYYSEFQISISQLLLRKQLEKGEFSSALRQIDEMRINVNTIKDKIHNIKHDIQRNIISDDTYERYKELIDDINRRLAREHEEFEELMEFIRDTKIRLDDNTGHTKKEKEALVKIVKIDNELGNVHYLHATLLEESIELKTTALESATESLYFVGLTSFNFDQEITRKYMNTPLPFESGKILASPFLKLKNYSTWSLLTIFEKQKIRREEEQLKNEGYIDVDNEKELNEILERQQRLYSYIIEELLVLMKDKKTITIKEIIETHKHSLFSTREFYDFFIILHQLSPINILDIANSREHVFALAFKKLIDICDIITATELTDEITYDGNYCLRNMLIELGGMKMINQDLVIEAFKIFSKLNANGEVLKTECNEFFTDETVRSLVMEFAIEVDCTIITAADYIYLVPLTKNSIYHITNSDIKRIYFPGRSLNMDIYLMYVAIIIFIGEFYDSYQSSDSTRDFITINDWLDSINKRMESLNQVDKETLDNLEQEYEYNWTGILKKWEAMDNIKEGVQKQTAKTVSRMGFMTIVKKFMLDQNLVNEIGPDELELTEKTKAIVARYFMEYEYNRGILDVIYQLENKE